MVEKLNARIPAARKPGARSGQGVAVSSMIAEKPGILRQAPLMWNR